MFFLKDTKLIQAFKGLWKTTFQWESVLVLKSLEVLIQQAGWFVYPYSLFYSFWRDSFHCKLLESRLYFFKKRSLWQDAWKEPYCPC